MAMFACGRRRRPTGSPPGEARCVLLSFLTQQKDHEVQSNLDAVQVEVGIGRKTLQ